MGQTLVLIGAVPGLLLLFVALLRLPLWFIAAMGVGCLTMPETRVFGIAFLVVAAGRYVWVRAHPAPEGAAREEFLRQEAEAKSTIYELSREEVEEARIEDEKREEEWVARSRRPAPVSAGEAMRAKLGRLFGPR